MEPRKLESSRLIFLKSQGMFIIQYEGQFASSEMDRPTGNCYEALPSELQCQKTHQKPGDNCENIVWTEVC